MTTEVEIEPGPYGAAQYLAWCAYPDEGEEERGRRQRWWEAAQVTFYKRFGKRPPPELRGHKRENATGLFKRGLKRLHHHRRVAVWIALRRLQPEGLGGLPPMEAYLEVARLAPGEFGFAGDEFTVARRWRESLPALAMMYPIALLTTDLLGLEVAERPALEDLLYARDLCDWQTWAINRAREIAPLIEREFIPARLLVPASVSLPQLKSPGFVPGSVRGIGLELKPQFKLPGPKR
jgi:hypothetical protein